MVLAIIIHHLSVHHLTPLNSVKNNANIVLIVRNYSFNKLINKKQITGNYNIHWYTETTTPILPHTVDSPSTIFKDGHGQLFQSIGLLQFLDELSEYDKTEASAKANGLV